MRRFPAAAGFMHVTEEGALHSVAKVAGFGGGRKVRVPPGPRRRGTSEEHQGRITARAKGAAPRRVRSR